MIFWPENWDDLPDGLYGDQDAFMLSVLTGEQSEYWNSLWWDNAVSDEARIRCWITSLNYHPPRGAREYP